MNTVVPMEIIEKKIYLIRRQKVMLDKDLAALYNVETRQLRRQVKRNIERFPDDFMFVLSDKETEQMVCHFGTPSKSIFGGYLPYVFTEHGILMLSSVLNSKRAIQVNIQIMRTFAKLCQILASHKDILKKVEVLESKYDQQFKVVFDAIRKLIAVPDKPKGRIGFQV
ncbi:MAG: ORF6N domain-containing protein [bacterium]